jgi:hypothetical protein
MYAATDAWVCISIYEKLMATEPIVKCGEESAPVAPTTLPIPKGENKKISNKQPKEATDQSEKLGRPNRSKFRYRRRNARKKDDKQITI